MNTNWLTPRQINFTPDPNNTNTVWTDILKDSVNLIFPIQTKKNVRRISLHDIATTTVLSDPLVLSGFSFPTYNTLVGMQIAVNVRRNSRVTDYVLQPFLGSTVYNNLATANGNAPNQLIYGSPTELWGMPNTINLSDSTFGIYYQVGPHPLYPGSDEAIIDRVQVQIFYQ